MIVKPSLMPFFIGKSLPKDVVHFVTERSAADAAQEISMQPWQDWIGRAKAPFQSMVIEWSPADMIDAMKRYGNRFVYAGQQPDDEIFEVESMNIHDGKVWFHVGSFKDKPLNIMLPWVVELDKPRDPSDPDQLEFEKIIYGVGYEQQFGSVPDVRVKRDTLYKRWNFRTREDEVIKVDLSATSPFVSAGDFTTLPDSLLIEFAGIVRFGLAMLALVNTQRETVEASGYKKSTMKKGKIYKLPETRLVVIRPDAVRKVYERGEPTGIKHREHGVRRHLRRYKSGKAVWVREHVRGDKDLGTVNKKYIVEMDPNS